MNLSLSDSLEARGVEALDDPMMRTTRFTVPCAWCAGRISTLISDRDLVAGKTMLRVVSTALDDSRAQHLAVHRCATAGHDPGDEDAGEDEARFDWRPA